MKKNFESTLSFNIARNMKSTKKGSTLNNYSSLYRILSTYTQRTSNLDQKDSITRPVISIKMNCLIQRPPVDYTGVKDALEMKQENSLTNSQYLSGHPRRFHTVGSSKVLQTFSIRSARVPNVTLLNSYHVQTSRKKKSAKKSIASPVFYTRYISQGTNKIHLVFNNRTRKIATFLSSPCSTFHFLRDVSPSTLFATSYHFSCVDNETNTEKNGLVYSTRIQAKPL